MKIFRYMTLGLAVIAAAASCDKHEVEYNTERVDPNKAQIQISRMIPEKALTANRAYRVELDGVPVFQNDYTYLSRLGTLPSVSRHYVIEPGTHNMKWYLKDGTLYYNQDFTVTKGQRCNLFVTDLDEPPVVIDYIDCKPIITETTSTYSYINFINLMYEKPGVKYPGKLRYYYQNPFDLEWYPVGEAVGFGENTGWIPILVDKFAPDRNDDGESGYGSSRNEDDNRTGHVVTAGNCRIYFKIMTCNADGSETGKWFTYSTDEGVTMRDYKDYWTIYIAYQTYHIMRGQRISASTNGHEGAWISTINKM